MHAAAAAVAVVSGMCLLVLVAFGAFECMLRDLTKKYVVYAPVMLCWWWWWFLWCACRF